MSETPPLTDAPRFAYEGPEHWQEPIARALRKVVDPEVALSILDVGLVYRVTVQETHAHILMTMTSAACPVTDVILDDAYAELEQVLPLVDMVLIMTVEPGFGGQAIMPECISKIRELYLMREKMRLSFAIEVDGGINAETIAISPNRFNRRKFRFYFIELIPQPIDMHRHCC